MRRRLAFLPRLPRPARPLAIADVAVLRNVPVTLGALSGLLRSLLVGLSPWDPLAFVGVAVAPRVGVRGVRGAGPPRDASGPGDGPSAGVARCATTCATPRGSS